MKNLIQSSLKLMPLIALALSFTFSSCKKGDTGPQGEAGKDGNANVKNLTVFINANEWVYKPGVCEVTKVVPEITTDLLNKGAVMVYMEGNGSGSWEALPTSATGGSGLVLAFGYIIESGKLNLSVTFNSSTTLPAGTISSGNYKIVLIAGSARAANPNVNYSDYKEVSTTFNLSE